MDFTLTDDQKLLCETVSSFTKKESPVGRVRKIRDNALGWDKGVWAQMGQLGWLGVALSEDVGGIGAAFADAALIIERLGMTLVPEPYVPSAVVAGLTLDEYGSDAQRTKLLPPMIEGQTSLALAFVERQGRYDVFD